MKVTTTTFEGTPDEYREFLAIQSASQSPGEPSDEQQVDGHQDTSADVVARRVKFIRSVLRRLHVPKINRELFSVLLAAGEQGVSRRELAEHLHLTDSQLAGVLGALGRRIHNTPGADEVAQEMGVIFPISIFLDGRQVDDQPSYRLRSDARRVLEAEGIVGAEIAPVRSR